MVMYLGQIVEIGDCETLFESPQHPYTRALLSSIPSMDPDHRTEEPPLSGDPPNPINPPSGCRFHTRCVHAQAICSTKVPKLVTNAQGEFRSTHHSIGGGMNSAQTTNQTVTDAHESPAQELYVDIRNLSVTFTGGRQPVKAVSGVNLRVNRGEVVALIGESGSGKSVTLRSILRLHNPARSKLEGQILVGGQDVVAMSSGQLSAFRGKVASMIFQEPLLALDPVYTVGAQIIEAILRHESISKSEARTRALSLFERVRIPSPERRLDAFPHEMSGGMRQRAMISLALASQPQLLLADEPTTALDATVQIQILLLLRELQRELGLSVIFVTHDLGAAVEVADRIAVMYAGRIVEEGNAR
jgi:peptide/nickel transport system ATP-binding protein